MFTWQLTEKIDAIVFDCDGTLSQVEGIDVLAKANGVDREVRALTEEAMSKTGINADIYKKRLDLVQPTQEQLATLSDIYYANLTPEVDKVIEIFHRLGKNVYVVSAGILSAVVAFVKWLGIPNENVFAVDIYFDKQGQYRVYDVASPMTRQRGKREVVEKLMQKHPRIVHVGDGMNDVEAAHSVQRFVGYGGAYFRESVASVCDFYIKSKTLSPLLPICLTQSEVKSLSASEEIIYKKGMHQIDRGQVIIK